MNETDVLLLKLSMNETDVLLLKLSMNETDVLLLKLSMNETDVLLMKLPMNETEILLIFSSAFLASTKPHSCTELKRTHFLLHHLLLVRPVPDYVSEGNSVERLPHKQYVVGLISTMQSNSFFSFHGKKEMLRLVVLPCYVRMWDYSLHVQSCP